MTGANGTYNYLIDLVLQVPATRAMYLRRLRTLMDTFLQGQLAQACHCSTVTGAEQDKTTSWLGSIC